jgi:site-specific DNA recombinase
MRLYSYNRVSTDDQKVGMAIYQENISWFCKRHGHTVIDEFTDEDVSGGKELKKRPSGEYLYQGLMLKQAEGVVCANVSRMFRDMEDGISTANRFKENGIKMFITDGSAEPIDIDTVQGFTMFTMQLLMAQIELMNIRTRTRNSARFRDRNNMASTHAQYGYDIVDKKQVVNEKEMRIVRVINSWRDSDNFDFKKIAELLNTSNIPSKNAGKVVKKEGGGEIIYSGKWSSKTVKGVYEYHKKKAANGATN